MNNLLIKGNCIKELPKLLNKYSDKIRCILIDPPYNTKIDYVRYRDAWNNAKWLSMMRKVLESSYKLLDKNGVMYICIDENEFIHLKLLCQKQFGLDNVKTLIWKKINKLFDSNRIEKKYRNVRVTHEYVLMCFKSFKNTKTNLIEQPCYERNKLVNCKQPLESVLDFMGTTSSAKDEIREIFGKREYFPTPKPLKLFVELIRAVTDKKSIVLDCFAGSGTTGHATMVLNNQDKGDRHFILISNNENNIFDEVLKKRIRYAKTEMNQQVK